ECAKTHAPLKPVRWRPPLSLTSLRNYPVTSRIALAAVALTLLWWSKPEIPWLFAIPHAWYGAIWHMVISPFLHVDLVHLGFNLYWLWIFGTFLEKPVGGWATAGIMLAFAVGSGAAEFALFIGGVGLSGVVYGLFGLLWILGRNDSRFAGVVDGGTVGLFLIWFVFCCFATAT